MLKKLRRKFVGITMTIFTVMLAVILGMILHFTADSLEQQSIRMLAQTAQEPMQPLKPDGPHKDRRQPYFVLRELPDGGILTTGSSLVDLSDEALMQSLLQQAWSRKQDTGVLQSYQLRYYRGVSPAGRFAAFADISAEQQMLRQLGLTCLTIGAVSFAALLGLSILLARWAIKPVEQAWQEQRQFVADASHELKTPLTVITTNAELLTQTEPDDPRQQQFAENIRLMSGQMRTLVESLLELARVDNGAMPMSPVNLSAAVSEAALPFEAVFFECGLTMETQIRQGISVQGSEGHLRQVVEILLDNARKYSVPNSCVGVRLERHGAKECRLQVINQGEPIPPEELQSIFKRFYRADKVRTIGESYGLGLAIAQEIVHSHKGQIWAASADGRNTFTVQLPLTNMQNKNTGTA